MWLFEESVDIDKNVHTMLRYCLFFYGGGGGELGVHRENGIGCIKQLNARFYNGFLPSFLICIVTASPLHSQTTLPNPVASAGLLTMSLFL